MEDRVQHLVNWSEWGKQWVQYLQHKPQIKGDVKRQLHKFHSAFQEIGEKATLFNTSNKTESEIVLLSTKAEDVQKHFQKILKLVQESSVDTTQRQQIPVARPVPVGGHKLPPLPYSYDALEPYIDAETMRIHHDKLHQNYVNGLNKAEMMIAQARATNNYDLIRYWEREAAFNGAGHYLHTIFWDVMSPKGGGNPQGELADQIIRDFGSIDAFKRQFSQVAENVQGPGWAILAWSPRAQHLEILQAEEHHLLTQWESIPLLVLDVWEHAYWLGYRSDRKRYIEAWWNIVNWPAVQERYLQARRLRWQPY
ncbi:superoxide dismutase [Brevibacillus ginsengisoli]|uniref:superoxide dismutase n=1 Tax=Brevibacillus ginsengisoli TaxID=363854 RepID=UPI003CF8B3A9